MEEQRVKDYYDSDDEENRFEPVWKRIELINTQRILSEYISPKQKVLDCAAGSGVYSFWLEEKGCSVVASDLSFRNAENIRNRAVGQKKNIPVYCCNAMDMPILQNEQFDHVLCFGPLYHLSPSDGKKCIDECMRVLKPGGMLHISYMNRHFIGLDLMFSDYYITDIDDALFLSTKGYLPKPRKGFFGCAYFSTPTEMEELCKDYEVVTHRSVDMEMGYFFKKMLDFDLAAIEKISDHIYKISGERTLLGSGKHNLIVVRKAVK